MPKFHGNESANVQCHGDNKEGGSADAFAEDSTDRRADGVGHTKTNHCVTDPFNPDLTVHVRLNRTKTVRYVS